MLAPLERRGGRGQLEPGLRLRGDPYRYPPGWVIGVIEQNNGQHFKEKMKEHRLIKQIVKQYPKPTSSRSTSDWSVAEARIPRILRMFPLDDEIKRCREGLS